jgi:hypothetical protein
VILLPEARRSSVALPFPHFSEEFFAKNLLDRGIGAFFRGQTNAVELRDARFRTKELDFSIN